jgi:predicted pyridoxine 5'-phosphate oxidase superfamily flavin-nucleotide-binding protein
MNNERLKASDIRGCFEGVIPAVIATASRDGCPNVTPLSRVFYVDDDHVALSNQFFSKTTRNLAENPYASVLLVDPKTYSQYRLFLKYERTERRGPLFERMEADIEAVAAITGMTGIFKLKSADIYRIVQLDEEPSYS